MRDSPLWLPWEPLLEREWSQQQPDCLLHQPVWGPHQDDQKDLRASPPTDSPTHLHTFSLLGPVTSVLPASDPLGAVTWPGGSPTSLLQVLPGRTCRRLVWMFDPWWEEAAASR